jgi:DNA-binding MarR family transcriptional regulator
MERLMSPSRLCINFLQLCESNCTLITHYSSHISPAALALFVVIVLNHEKGHPLNISDAMALDQMASSAALHKRINDLREAGMVCVTFKGKNRRTKFLAPTDKGERYLKLMGQLLRRASKPSLIQ